MLYCSHHLIFHTWSFLCIMKLILHNHRFYHKESRVIMDCVKFYSFYHYPDQKTEQIFILKMHHRQQYKPHLEKYMTFQLINLCLPLKRPSLTVDPHMLEATSSHGIDCISALPINSYNQKDAMISQSSRGGTSKTNA